MSVYAIKPERFLRRLHFSEGCPSETLCCAGFELRAWRCEPFARHLMDWLPDYALTAEELSIHHGNAYEKLRQAAARVYHTDKSENRGEVGEIALHVVCRDFFHTVPISPRVFYLSASNDVVKGFDMVHAAVGGEHAEIWLGESKFYSNRARAVADAINSVAAHIDRGFLTNEKLLIGPQIPKDTPRYAEIQHLFRSQTSIDELIRHSTFAIAVIGNSKAVMDAEEEELGYEEAAKFELDDLVSRLRASKIFETIKINLVYIPVRRKTELVAAFDKYLKGLTR
jgi:hypothetical protein